jgi:ATP-dependent protease Clp ATPase subunit
VRRARHARSRGAGWAGWLLPELTQQIAPVLTAQPAGAQALRAALGAADGPVTRLTRTLGEHGVQLQLTPCALNRLLAEATHRATGLSGLHVLLEDLAIDLCWGPVAPGPLLVDAQRVERFLPMSGE